jgi:hypothetical protein
MRTTVTGIARWNMMRLTAIFGLHRKRRTPIAMPQIPRTADGFCCLGVHHPTDVVAGTVLGSLGALGGIAAAN